MNHLTEETLIAYQLGEAEERTAEIAGHLERCPDCAGNAEEIALTLRIFSAELVPAPNLDHAWQRLQGSLPPARPVRLPATIARWLRFALPILAVLLVASALTLRTHLVTTPGRPLPLGPLTQQPRDPQLATHLDNAERLLTTISHEPGTPDANTRAQAEKLLVQNAVYVREARTAGELSEASVLEDLGRTLTTLSHAPEADKGWHLRMELSADGLLLEVRILQQNDTHTQVSGPTR